MNTIGARCLALALLVGFIPASATGREAAASEAAATTPERPAYSFLRQNEDWSVLADGAPSPGDVFDPIKYVQITRDDWIWASFGGSLRGRLDNWLHFAFGAPATDDDSFGLARVLLHGDLHVGETARLFVELKSALSTDRELPGGRRDSDSDYVALQQAFVDLSLPFAEASSVTLRLGRRGLQYGRQRLVSPLPWANTLRTWDGASVQLAHEGWLVDAFWTLFVPVRQEHFNEPDEDEQFFGVYATGTPWTSGVGVDVYFLGRMRDGAFVRNGTIGNEDDRYTLGARIVSPFGTDSLGLQLEIEGAYQLGSVGDEDVRAFMLALEVSAQGNDLWGKPRLALGLDYASGDSSPGGTVETFDQLYPLGHAYFGQMDFVGRQNVFAISPSLSVRPGEGITFLIGGQIFRRPEPTDAFYDAGGGVVRAGAAGTSRDLGSEIDLVLKKQLGIHFTGEVGYSHFFPGRFLEETGSDEEMDYIYLQLAYRF